MLNKEEADVADMVAAEDPTLSFKNARALLLRVLSVLAAH